MPSTFRHSLSHVQIRQIRSGIAGLKKTQGNPHAWVRSSSGPNLGKNEHFFSDVSLLSRKSFFSVYSYDFSFVRILTYFIYKDVDTNLPSIQHLYVHLYFYINYYVYQCISSTCAIPVAPAKHKHMTSAYQCRMFLAANSGVPRGTRSEIRACTLATGYGWLRSHGVWFFAYFSLIFLSFLTQWLVHGACSHLSVAVSFPYLCPQHHEQLYITYIYIYTSQTTMKFSYITSSYNTPSFL